MGEDCDEWIDMSMKFDDYGICIAADEKLVIELVIFFFAWNTIKNLWNKKKKLESWTLYRNVRSKTNESLTNKHFRR